MFIPLTCVLWFSHSLRVNLDMGKIVYSWVIRRDSKIPGTVVRSSTIPEQLGRISYLLTDKTGEFPAALAGFKVEEGAWNLFPEVLEMHAAALLFSSSFMMTDSLVMMMIAAQPYFLLIMYKSTILGIYSHLLNPPPVL